MKEDTYVLTSSEQVDAIKKKYNITLDNEDMTDKEIRLVVSWFGDQAPDTKIEDGKIIYGKIGYDIMLSITLLEFSEYYERMQLAQWQ